MQLIKKIFITIFIVSISMVSINAMDEERKVRINDLVDQLVKSTGRETLHMLGARSDSEVEKLKSFGETLNTTAQGYLIYLFFYRHDSSIFEGISRVDFFDYLRSIGVALERQIQVNSGYMTVAKLCEGLRDNSFTSLRLQGKRWNNICYKDIELIAEALSENTSLKSLTFLFASINREDIKKILDALVGSESIEELGFVFCSIGMHSNLEGVAYIAEFLVLNKSLRRLNLMSNFINCEGAMLLADALEHNQSLCGICLTHDSGYRTGSEAVEDRIDNYLSRNMDAAEEALRALAVDADERDSIYGCQLGHIRQGC